MRKLSNELYEQIDWAVRTLVGRKFVNKKTKGIYIVKSIAVDTETEELRVIYCDGVSTNDWDRPMLLFIEKFEEYKEQGE